MFTFYLFSLYLLYYCKAKVLLRKMIAIQHLARHTILFWAYYYIQYTRNTAVEYCGTLIIAFHSIMFFNVSL